MSYYDTFKKRDETILFTKNSLSHNKNWCYKWFLNNYETWEEPLFDIFNKFLSKEKVFIDIGGWIGTTCLYAAKKSKYVYVVEADPLSVIGLESNLKLNKLDNIEIIEKAIYNEDDIKIKFGRNRFTNAEWNTSTSQILLDNIEYKNENFILAETITFNSIINKYNIDPYSISLIKVDIEGGEENILEELYEFHKKYKIPLYVGFHLSWWKNKNIRRFNFLSDDQINKILNNNFDSILFE